MQVLSTPPVHNNVRNLVYVLSRDLNLAHELHPVPYHTDHCSCLNAFRATPCHPVLNVRQTVQPCYHDFGLDIELGNLLRQGCDDVGQRESARNLQGVDRCQAGSDIACAKEGPHNVLNSIWWWCGDTVIDGLDGDSLSDNVLLRYLGLVSWLQRRTCNTVSRIARTFRDAGTVTYSTRGTPAARSKPVACRPCSASPAHPSPRARS